VDANGSPDLAEIRQAIDKLDGQIVDLIAERQKWVQRAGQAKGDQDEDAVRAPARVDAVIARVRALAVSAGASPEVVERTFRALIAAFVDLELSVHAREGSSVRRGALPSSS
jgi:isochorismate pyruvate lyase